MSRAAIACPSVYIKQATSEPTNVVTPITTRLFPAPVKALGDGAGMLADGCPPGLELLPVVPLEDVVVFPFIMPGIVLGGADMAFWANASMVLPVLALGLYYTESVSHGVLERKRRRRSSRVNNPNHALLTMLALATIIPEWQRIFYHHCECWHLRIRCLHRHIA